MNINYDEIIHRANERAEKLKALNEKLTQAKGHATALSEALAYFDDLREARDQLDSEGLAMLGPLGSYIHSVGSTANVTTRSLFGDSRSPQYLPKLVELIEQN